MACDQAECSAWVPSSNNAAPYISRPEKAVNFNCQSSAYGQQPPSDPAFWDDRGKVLDAIYQSGAKWVRINWLSWVAAQTDPTDQSSDDQNYYDDAGYLAIIKECVRKMTSSPYLLKVLLVVQGTPDYANGLYGKTVGNIPPTDCRSNTAKCDWFKNFIDHILTNTLQPYRSKIALEIWNEPNLDTNWAADNEADDDDFYYYLLRAAYSKVDSIDSSVTVLMGGAARDSSPAVETWDMKNWVKDIYDRYDQYHCTGDNPCSTRPWDVVAVHPYPDYRYDASRPCPTVGDVFADVYGAVLDTMKNHSPSDANKSIWLTEAGWSSGDDYDGVANGNAYNVCSQPLQVAQLKDAYRYKWLPSTAARIFWWISDRKILNKRLPNDQGCSDLNLPRWACGTELLDANLTHLGKTKGLYDAFDGVLPP